MAMNHCTKEMVWRRHFLAHMGYVQNKLASILCFKKICIALAIQIIGIQFIRLNGETNNDQEFDFQTNRNANMDDEVDVGETLN